MLRNGLDQSERLMFSDVEDEAPARERRVILENPKIFLSPGNHQIVSRVYHVLYLELFLFLVRLSSASRPLIASARRR